MDTSNSHVRINDQDYPVSRLKLRAWLYLEDIRDKIVQEDAIHLADLICQYVTLAIPVSIDILQTCPWYEVANAYKTIYAVNLPNTELPLIRPRESHKKVTGGFDYPDRNWFMWAHVLASSYGWTLEYIAELDIDTGISLIQEILYQEQLDREWLWSTQEIAYSYDANSKTSKFIPLKRPDWMMMTNKPTEVKKTKIKASELPVGLILRWDNGNQLSN